MSLETIIKKILEDAQAEAEGIVEGSMQKAEGLREEAKKEAIIQGEILLQDAEIRKRMPLPVQFSV